MKSKYVICINNKNYEASLDVKKIYRIISDLEAEKENMIRVIDESGEDYLYEANKFVPVKIPETVETLF
ncbi:MAG: hypothetical protein OEZ22_13640 [Spirochaetia bacterium]|nr:hypothetical protein [Spirochaetia bacterium]